MCGEEKSSSVIVMNLLRPIIGQSMDLVSDAHAG